MATTTHATDDSMKSRVGKRLVQLADRVVLGTVNAAMMVADGSRAQMGNAPKDVILRHGKLQVARLRPRSDELFDIGVHEHALSRGKFPTPILLIPPLMVRPYVYDLRPDHSLARSLRDRGFDVFIVDFGVPGHDDRDVTLDDYVLSYVPRAVDAVVRASGSGDITLAGYCMGGIFALLHAAAHQNARVRNLVTIGAPVNFGRMGVLTVAARVGVPLIDPILDRVGNVPAFAAVQGFKLMSGTRAITKWGQLFVRLYDEEYVRSFDTVNTWVNDLLPYPRAAFKQLVREVVTGNKLLTRELVLGGKRADLATIEQPLLAFAGRSDNIATPDSTRQIVDLVSSADTTLLDVPGGHVGVVAGSAAPAHVWTPMAEWLAPRSV